MIVLSRIDKALRIAMAVAACIITVGSAMSVALLVEHGGDGLTSVERVEQCVYGTGHTRDYCRLVVTR